MKNKNIIFINIDDMGWKDLACTGSTFYETPNIDALSREGMNFQNAYASCPVCSPSRASFHTGKHPARIALTDWIDEFNKMHPLKGKLIDAPYVKHMDLNEMTIAKKLHKSGYVNYHIGKWHLGSSEYYPEHFGFDVNIGGCWWGNPKHGYFSPYKMENLEDGPEGEYLTDRLTDEAINLIKNPTEDKPFFMNLCYYAVHSPIQAKEEDIEYFKEKSAKLGLDKIEAIVEGEYFHTIDKKDRRIKRRIIQSDPVYAAMVYNLDRNIGRLMKELKDSGKANDTVVIFTSDNGGLATSEGSPTCNLPAKEGKGWLYEGGIRVPLIVWNPEMIKPFSRCDVPVVTMDFYPTILDICNIDLIPEQHMDGVSILPLLKGEAIEDRPLFWHYPHYGNQGGLPGSIVLYNNFKLIENFEDETSKLFNLKSDFSENNDVSNEYPEVKRDLLLMLHGWQTDIGARFPSVNDSEL